MRKEKSEEKIKRVGRFRPPTPTQVIAAAFGVLFAAMIVYLCRYAYVNRQVMMSNSYNSRQKILLEQNTRGDILAASGEVLATTERKEDGSEERVYPYGNLFSHAVGYSAKGMGGVEAAANYYLIRSDIPLSKKAELMDKGEKYPGNTVITTLDRNLQETAYQALSAYRGAIVVTDVRTGAILAMVSKPDFDPNEINALWPQLTADKEDSRLLNRVSQGLYPPGSTFKIVTALEYIRENPADYGKYSFNCSGSYTAEGLTIHCFHGESHGRVDFYTSLQKSCNSSFANIGMSLDRGAFAKTLKTLYFGEELPVDFPCGTSRTALSASSGASEVMQLSIGQGATSISPLHLNMITQSIASGGEMYKPYIIDRIVSADDKVLVSNEKEKLRRVMSAEEAQILTEMMTTVVNGGTARRLQGLSYQAAGKTGSAEYNSAEKTESHAWFTGFAPADDPQIAVTVIIEQAGSGGEYAVPMAKRVFDTYFEAED